MADSTQEWTVVQGAFGHDVDSEGEARELAAQLNEATGSRPPAEVKTRWVPEWLPADVPSSPLRQGEEEPEPEALAAAELKGWKAAMLATTPPTQPGEVERLKRSYELKVQDFARETLKVSNALRACEPANVPRYVVGEAGHGYMAAQDHIRKILSPDADGVTSPTKKERT